MGTISQYHTYTNHKTLKSILKVIFKSLLQSSRVSFWAKYKGEKHLPSYNYLGPNTRLDIRLNENNIPKSREEPINAIDHLAYIHDLAYQNSNNIKGRHRADQEMINGLKQLKKFVNSAKTN